jgi:hypothetical protein
VLASLLALTIAQTPTATTAASGVDLSGLQFHGFISQGGFKSTSNNYLGESKRGSLAFTEVGFNATYGVTEDLTAGLQFFARSIGTLGNFSAKFDWFYLDYHWSDRLGIRAGRVKLPFGLYNEFSDIDSARVPILLPQGVYPITNRDYLLAQTGVDIYGRIPLSVAGDLDYRLYGGTILFDDFGNSEDDDGPFEVRDVSTRYIVGGRLLWETPLAGLRLAGSVQALRIDFDLVADPSLVEPLRMAGTVAPDFTGRFKASIPAILWIVSIEYVAGDFFIASEYSRWIVDIVSRQPALVPESSTEREQFYVMTDYRVVEWFHPGVYYSAFFPNAERRSGRAAAQHDVALTLRFDINPYWLVKIEGHYMSGTAVLRPELNDFRPANTLDRHWGFFLAKTTLSF